MQPQFALIKILSIVMKRTLLALTLLLSCLTTFSQYYQVLKYPIKAPPSRFKIDTLSYQISSIEDNRENQSQLGEVYFGILNHKVLLKTKNGVKQNFTKYFERALSRTDQGELKIKVTFNKLFIHEDEKHIDTTGGRYRSYGINVDYHLIKDEGEIFLLNDYRNIDSLATQSKYDLNVFCNHFFEQSLQELEKYLIKNPSIINQEVKQAPVKDSVITEERKPDTSLNKNSLANTEEEEKGIKSGEIKLKIKKNKQIIYKSSVEYDELKKAISNEYANNEHGNYVISYKIDQSKDPIKVKELTTVDYKQSFNVSPFYYIVVPLILIISIAGAS